MSFSFLKKIIVFILVLCIKGQAVFGIFTGDVNVGDGDSSHSAAASENTYQFPERTAIKFGDMGTELYDEKAMNEALDDMEQICDSGDGTLDDLHTDWNIIVDQYDRIVTDHAVANIHYYQDVNDDEAFEIYSEIDEQITELADRLMIVLSVVMDSDYAEDMSDYISCDRLIEDATGYVPMTDREFELEKEYTDLVDKYYEALDADDSGSELICKNIYLEIIDNLTEQQSYDDTYDTYAENVYYNGFMRDYSPDDVEVLYQWTKEFVVPYFFEVIDKLSNSRYLNSYYALSFDTDEIMEMMAPCTAVSEKAQEAFDCLMEYDLCDIEVSENKIDGGFTTDLYYYGIPFIFNCPSDSYSDYTTMVHEFGHFYDMYVNMKPVLYEYSCIDTCEIESQGMEMLATFSTSNYLKEGLYQTANMYSMYGMLSTIIDGCVFDQFQQEAFKGRADGTIKTAEDLDELFCSIEESYYGDGLTNWGTYWYYVPHSYESPFYYISYATSATAALGILSMANEDYDSAVDLYNELIEMGTEYGFCATLDKIGLPDPLKKEGTDALTEGLSIYFRDVMNIEP